MSFQVFDEHTLVNYLTRIANAQGTTPVAVATAPQPGLRIDAIIAGNDDSIDHVVEFGIDNGAQAHYLGSVVVPAGAGQGGVPAVDVLAALQVGTLGAVLVAPDIEVVARVPVAMQGASYLYLTTVGGLF
jgi:hypothetical protein